MSVFFREERKSDTRIVNKVCVTVVKSCWPPKHENKKHSCPQCSSILRGRPSLTRSPNNHPTTPENCTRSDLRRRNACLHQTHQVLTEIACEYSRLSALRPKRRLITFQPWNLHYYFTLHHLLHLKKIGADSLGESVSRTVWKKQDPTVQ